MNNRRQTIWLVSMLSLMVILSAYYLFTEPVNPAQNANNGSLQSNDQTDAAKANGSGDQGIKTSEVNQNADSGTDSATGVDDQKDAAASDNGNKDTAAADNGKKDGKSSEASGDGTVSPSDEEVLSQMANLTGARYFDDLRRKAQENYDRAYEEQNKIVADTKRYSPEDAATAVEKMHALEETDQRIEDLETKLMQDFENAVVVQEDTNFKILVQTASFDKKKAVKVIDQAVKELLVKPDRLSVEYIKP
ncbi:SpoIIIAH-like family protein [Cohnella pontilimi]|uniref:SpoIIIAH-like family protein n=1 Tax=Cohnella pontilimi TaxID=2564100 RepID=A0A4U0FHL8_9BACL|nr:SpoIIIAH-like family protein [Cohnella pontilimi]TJY44451.1 SpoIIIAH-like family protein [Cohnella pontilimi]